MTDERAVAWFSCGAASAVAAKLAQTKYGDRLEVVYCDTMATEHPDNARFFADVEHWLGQPITIIKSDRYDTVDDVFEQRRYLSGVAGALCTVEMKKVPRFDFQRADDIHIFGYTASEGTRIKRLRQANPELALDFILHAAGYKKADCFAALRKAGIELPAMYGLGYHNNNCLGCVKATSFQYWQAIRHDFPEVFERRVRQSRELGVRLARVNGQRVFLDELPDGYNPRNKNGQDDLSCGPECQLSLLDQEVLS